MSIDPRTKLAVLLAFNILALTFDKLENLLALTFTSIAIYTLTRPNIERIKLTALVVVPPMWGMMLLQALFYQEWPRTVLAVIVPPSTPILGPLTGGVYLYYQGFLYGLKQSLRLVSVMLLGLAIAWTTGEGALLKALRSSISNQKLTIAITIAARFLHVVINEVKTTYISLSLAGERKLTKMLLPVIAQIIRRSYTTTLALLSKGFNPTAKTKSGTRLTTLDKAIIAAALIPSATLGTLKLLATLFLLDVLYIPALRDVYWWVINNV